MKNVTTISLKREYSTQEITFTNVDVSLDQYFEAFKGMLVGAGWSETTVNKYIVELAEDLKDVE